MRKYKFFILSLLAASSVIVIQAEPAPAKVDNPRTVVVGERSVVDIYVSQFQDTLIVLPPSEKVRQTFVGDSANWALTTGKSDEPTRYISIKVKEPIVKQTTVNVLSDHDKSYTFRLILSTDHCDSKVFIDPDSQLSLDLAKPPVFVSVTEFETAKKEAAVAKTEAAQAVQREQGKAQTEIESFRSKYPGTLRFDYHWDQKVGDKLGVIQIFRDDKFTYIAAQPQETPTLYEVKDGKPSLINFDFANGLYTIPKHVERGYLAIGKQRMDFWESAQRP
ncbi:MAG: TrbG/VirB9 family P-type conjugative transfer protein [Acidobacteriaceae bacterium]|nr:TrbG/VirB9 family P-type conjugative transfer protein [Acidobacteriaceae bacterium]MBV9764355.1 TrbG/VirB9 family P-type conjugative transfer protein [Acidobacteriaceae bacterium]